MAFSRRLVILLLFPLIYLSSCEDGKIDFVLQGTISGVVLRLLDDAPLQGVTITTNPATSVVITDGEGKFTIEDVQPGNYTVNAELSGFERETAVISVSQNGVADVTIKLDRGTAIPELPTEPSPAPGAVDQPRTLTLSWTATPIPDDTLSYDIRVFESDLDSALITVIDHPDTALNIQDLRFNTTYFWQVVVRSLSGGETKGDVWSFRTEGFPDNRITYSLPTNGNYEIFSSSPTGEDNTQLTFNAFNDLKPLFDNNRNFIAFSANEDLNYHIFIMTKDGKDPFQVTTVPIAGLHSKGTSFTWSPDNGRFAYASNDKLYVINRDGTGLNAIIDAPAGRHFRDCDWSGVTDRIVVETIGANIWDSEILILDSDGTDSTTIVANLPGIIGSPTFSIDGTQVMYTNDASGLEQIDGRQLDSRIFILDLASSTTVDLSGGKANGTNDLSPRFSPDGSKVIFVNRANDGSGDPSIWIMDVDGQNRTQLFAKGDLPSWQ